MDSKKEVLAFLKKLHDEIEADHLIAKHVRVLISNTDEVLGNGVLLLASPSPAQVTDTMYMCMGILCAIRDQALRAYACDPDILSGFRSFLADIDKSLIVVDEGRMH